MPPSSAAPLSEISSIACRLRNPARLCSLAVCWRHYPDGGPSTAGCSLKLSSNITLWWAVGWTTNWPERKILLIIINCLVDALVLKSEVVYANKVPKFQVNFDVFRDAASYQQQRIISIQFWNIVYCLLIYTCLLNIKCELVIHAGWASPDNDKKQLWWVTPQFWLICK